MVGSIREGGDCFDMLDKKEFFDEYKLETAFEHSELKWETLEQIYNDYSQDDNIRSVCDDLQNKLSEIFCDEHIHSIHCRVKNPKHLIEKIIRKRGIDHRNKYKDISVNNYKEIVRDLIGARILLFSKEEWEKVFDILTDEFPYIKEEQNGHIVEEPIAYTRYGDRDIFKKKIKPEHSNRGYRSQHYIIKYKEYFCEIQVRTLPEEVHGEFDHLVKYPYHENNNFLRRYTSTISQLLDAVDELISTCIQMKEEGWEECDKYYMEDQYIDWINMSQEQIKKEDILEKKNYSIDGNIDAATFLENKMLRKENRNEN